MRKIIFDKAVAYLLLASLLLQSCHNPIECLPKTVNKPLESKEADIEFRSTRKSLREAQKIEQLLSEELGDSYSLGVAEDTGDCFFDALAQCLNRTRLIAPNT